MVEILSAIFVGCCLFIYIIYLIIKWEKLKDFKSEYEEKKINKTKEYNNHVNEVIKRKKYGYASFYKFVDMWYENEWNFEPYIQHSYTFYRINRNNDSKVYIIYYYTERHTEKIKIKIDGYYMVMETEDDYFKLLDFLDNKIKKNNYGIEIKEW